MAKTGSHNFKKKKYRPAGTYKLEGCVSTIRISNECPGGIFAKLEANKELFRLGKLGKLKILSYKPKPLSSIERQRIGRKQ